MNFVKKKWSNDWNFLKATFPTFWLLVCQNYRVTAAKKINVKQFFAFVSLLLIIFKVPIT